MYNLEAIFPDVFIEGKIPLNSCDASLCADGLMGWALCMSGNKPPANFGKGMSAIGQRLNITPIAENLSKLAKKRLVK